MKKMVLGLGVLASLSLASGEQVEITSVETAAICGFRQLWDKPILTSEDGMRKPGEPNIVREDGGGLMAPISEFLRSQGEDGLKPAALAFDAIHRMLLVRFPDAAEQLAAKLKDGYEIEKVELALPFLDEEIWPEGAQGMIPWWGVGYNYRANWDVDKMYLKIRPTWHAIAYGLLKPWKSDADIGPTYNAYINGAGYWKHFGAQDKQDRVDVRFGPTPVHYQNTEGRMDVTAALSDEQFGKTLAERLRRLSDCGFLLKKWETYDHLYFQGPYEWGTGTGPRAIIIKNPKLVVTLGKAKESPAIELPPAADIDALAKSMKDGKPTAVMPTTEELVALEKALGYKKPADMEDWQWQKVQELFKWTYGDKAMSEPFWNEFVSGGTLQKARAMEDPVAAAMFTYEYFIDDIIGLPSRGWNGFEAGPVLLTWFLYRDILPLPAQERYKDYWADWLVPERATAENTWDPDDFSGDMIHPQLGTLTGDKKLNPLDGDFDKYYTHTKDWRGNKSFYRSGYTRNMSTMNFNNTSSMGALLGGAVVDSEKAMEDGRFGQNTFALKLWCWSDGSSQEEGDDYYFCVTLRAQKMIMDFGPELVDRLMGKAMLLKSMTMIVDTYHPNLRRYITGSSRTALHYRLVSQDGMYHILHTLSKKGTKTDLDLGNDTLPEGEDKWGHDFAPGTAARSMVTSSYAPTWYQQVVDDKIFPYEVKATETRWGGFRNDPVIKTSYLGRNYGLYNASYMTGCIPSIFQWRRKTEQVTTSRELGTMVMRSGINGDTSFVNHDFGWYKDFGAGAILQHKNKFIATYSPSAFALQKDHNVSGFQTSMGFFNYELPSPTWEIYVDGKKTEGLPVECKPGQVIAIKDGVTYMGIIPLPGSARNGGGKVVLRVGNEQEYLRTHKATAALVIDNIVYQNDKPFDSEEALMATARLSTGFAMEVADAEDYGGDFSAFLASMQVAKVTSVVDEEAGTHEVIYVSGGDTLEMIANTKGTGHETRPSELFVKRLANGESPDLPTGVDRVSPFSLISRTGKLELGGNILTVTEGAIALLQKAPQGNVVLAANPMPDLVDFALKTADGVDVTANGKVGILFVTLDHGKKTLTIDHDFYDKTQAQDDGAASALTVSGLKDGYAIVFNGKATQGNTIALK